MTGKRIIIVGGGASGAILAARLLGRDGSRVKVAIIEQRPEIGRGIAYSTQQRDHILNTRAGSMSAFAEDSEHFWRWLIETGAPDDLRCSDPFCFVSRSLYGRYLGDLLKPWLAETGDGRLEIVSGECTGIRTTAGGVVVDLADNTSHIGHAAVLATGLAVPGFAAGSPYIGAWSTPAEAGIGPDDPVLILGTGLSMVDAVIQLANEGHRGKITALSRRGLLPRVHKRNTPIRIDAADVPFGTEISYLLHWFRQTVVWASERGGDWRDVVDGIRPHTAKLWQSLTPEAKKRFLRHVRTFWEVHRHRLPPESEVKIRAATTRERLDIVTGYFQGVETKERGVEVRFRRRGTATAETLSVGKVIDCTGILRDVTQHREGLIASLIERGLARPDALKIGIDVDEQCAVVNQAGQASPTLFAVGPVTRARFWEVTAIPDIRLQCAALAERLHAVLQDAPRTVAPLSLLR